MKATACLLLCLVLLTLGLPNAPNAARAASAPPRTTVSQVLPDDLVFEQNVGQTDPSVAYLARGAGHTIFMARDKIAVSMGGERPEAMFLEFAGARSNTRLVAGQPTGASVNYLHGSDRSEWRRGIPTYSSVRYEGLYDGVAAVFSGTQQRLDYSLEIAPGIDLSRVRMRIEGADSLSLDASGDLVVHMRGGTVRHGRARARQTNGAKRQAAVRYALAGANEVAFDVDGYDRTSALVVTGSLGFVDYLASSTATDACTAVALDASGNIYVTGHTNATDFPVVPGAPGAMFSGAQDAFVAKLTPDASSIVFATYLGGSYLDSGVDLAVDASGAVYVLGKTQSADFPTTPSAFDRVLNLNGSVPSSFTDSFVAKISSTGDSLVYATYLGGDDSETPGGIAVDASGAAYVCGYTDSSDFPTTPGAFDTSVGVSTDAYVTKLNATGSALVYSTFLGGSGADTAWDVVVNGSGNAIVTGQAGSAEFPTTSGAYDETYSGGDSFLTELNTTGSALSFSTFIGPTSTGHAIAFGPGGTVCVTGNVGSPSFPTTSGAYDTTFNGGTDMFAARLSASGNALLYSTFVGGPSSETANAIAVDGTGAIYLTGYADSNTFPTTPGAFDQTFHGQYDAVAVKLSATDDSLAYATYLGGTYGEFGHGVAVADNGEAIVVGETMSPDFPHQAGLNIPRDFSNGFVTRLNTAGSSLVYSSFVGGTAGGSGTNSGQAVTVDDGGFVYITGVTYNPNFPTTPGAADTEYGPYSGNSEVFVTKLTPGGASLLYSTYLGGQYEDDSAAIVVDDSGIATIAGGTNSPDFPVTPGAYVNNAIGPNAFVVKLSADGGSILLASVFGGNSVEYGNGLAIDANGSIFVAGETWSSDFPTTAGAFDTTLGGTADGFVARLSADGSTLVYGTYLGGDFRDHVNGIAVGADGVATVVGETQGNFPVTGGAFDTTHHGGDIGYDGFVAKIAASGSSLVYGTYLGGSADDYLHAVAVDADGAAYVAGESLSIDFPLTGPLLGSSRGSLLTKLASDGASLDFSTMLGSGRAYAVAVDANGSAVVTGEATTGFPTTPGAYQTTLGGDGFDAFVTRFHPSGASLLYSTLFGGVSQERGFGVALDAAGTAYVTGEAYGGPVIPATFGYGSTSSAFVLEIGTDQTLGADTLSVYVPSNGTWFLKNSLSGGAADLAFSYGPGGLGFVPLSGDWNGNGDDTSGLYDPQSGFFFLHNSNAPGAANAVFGFGPGAAGFVPLSGDWNGDGIDTVGLYDPSSGFFFLRDQNAPGPADVLFGFGPSGLGWQPVAGDWNGDGIDTVGLYDPSSGFFFLRDQNAPGPADLVYGFGPSGLGWLPLTGDWDGDGIDTVGLYDPSSGFFFLRNQNAPGPADVVYGFGAPNLTPIAGDWDGL